MFGRGRKVGIGFLKDHIDMPSSCPAGAVRDLRGSRRVGLRPQGRDRVAKYIERFFPRRAYAWPTRFTREEAKFVPPPDNR